MNENVNEFSDRESILFRSVRDKKDKTPNKKKSTGAKSLFTSLLLANYDHQNVIQFDPHASLSSSITYEKFRDQAIETKLKAENMIAVDASEKKPNADAEENCESPDSGVEVDAGIILKVDAFIYDLYEDILYNILHHLNRDIDDENDLPSINENSAICYVKDAFGITDKKHEEIYDKVQAKPPADLEIDNVEEIEENAEEPTIEFYSMLSKKTDSVDALEAHACLLKILLKHELELSNTPHYYWCDKFSFIAKNILKAHSEFRYITDVDLHLARWSAFTEIHRHHPLDLSIFIEILDKIVEQFEDGENVISRSFIMGPAKVFLPKCFGMNPATENIQMKEITEKIEKLRTRDEKIVAIFWEAGKVLNESLLLFISKLSEESDFEYIKVELLRKTFMIVNKIKKLEDFDLNIKESVKDAIAVGAANLISRNVDAQILTRNEPVLKLKELTRLFAAVTADFATLPDRFGFLFEDFLGICLTETLYTAYDKKLSEIVKPIVLEISKSKEGHVDTFSEPGAEHDVAKGLFELYLQLKVFSDKGMELYIDKNFEMKEYFTWFVDGIDRWCKASVFSALTRIEKAIALDTMKPYDSYSKHSSSAVHVLTILYSVKTFWENVKWPISEVFENICITVSGDICRFAVIYFDGFAARVEQTDSLKNVGIYQVPLEVSVAIANINFISQGIQKLIIELTENKSQDNARLQNIIGNALKLGKSRILKLMNNSVRRMAPTIRKLALEGVEIVNNKSEIGDRLITYFDDSLSTLKKDLNENDFETLKCVLWKAVLDIMFDVIEINLKFKRPPIFFTHLKKLFCDLQKDFENIELENLNDKTREVMELLERHEVNTSKLIHQYFKERHQMQTQIAKSPFNPFGVLSIKCFFINNVLKLEVLNAKNLVPLGGSRKPDSFVKISFVPALEFPDFQQLKTKTETETHFPLYDDYFEFELTPKQRNMKDAIIFFNIKDRLLFSSNQCLAEAFLAFADIPEYSQAENQIHLTLTRLQSEELESLKTLYQRSQGGDKAAKDFLAKIKSKVVAPNAKFKSLVTKI